MKKIILVILILVLGIFGYAFWLYGFTPLMFVASDGSPKTVSTLVKFGADVNVKDEEGWTPLLIATRNNENSEVVEVLLQNGADVNAKKEDGKTALMLALSTRYNDHPEIAEILVKHGADVNAKDKDGYTPLMLAVSEGDSKIVTTLISKGADVNAKDEKEWTPLYIAAGSSKDLKVIQTLIENGAEIYDEERLLNLLEQNKNFEHNQDYQDLKDRISGQVGKEEAEAENVSTVQSVDKNILADVNLMKTVTLEQLEKYIAQGADVNAKDKDGWTPLLLAVIKNPQPQVAETLLKHGADVNAKGKSGLTALMVASLKRPQIVAVLLKHGADVNIQSDARRTALVYACSQSANPQVIQMLLDRGATIQNANQLLNLLDKNKNMPKNQNYQDLKNRIANESK